MHGIILLHRKASAGRAAQLHAHRGPEVLKLLSCGSNCKTGTGRYQISRPAKRMKYVEIGEPKKRNSRLTVKTEPFEDGLERERPSTLHKRVPRKMI